LCTLQDHPLATALLHSRLDAARMASVRWFAHCFYRMTCDVERQPTAVSTIAALAEPVALMQPASYSASRAIAVTLTLTLACCAVQVAAGRAERRVTRGLDSPETPDRPELRSAVAKATRAPAVQATAENGDDEPEAAGSSGAAPHAVVSGQGCTCSV